MTLDQIKTRCRSVFCINEITGALAQLTPNGEWEICIQGDQHSPSVLCMLLFDERHIAENWSPITVEEAIARIDRERMKAIENLYPSL